MLRQTIRTQEELNSTICKNFYGTIADVIIQLDTTGVIRCVNMKLENVDFVDCTFTSAVFTNTVFINCNFIRCTMDKADFECVTIRGRTKPTCFFLCCMKGAKFFASYLANVNFSHSNVIGASFSHATLNIVKWAGTNRSFCNFDYSSFGLYCGSSRFTCDMGFIKQLCAHMATLTIIDETSADRKLLVGVRKLALASKYMGAPYLMVDEQSIKEIKNKIKQGVKNDKKRG